MFFKMRWTFSAYTGAVIPGQALFDAHPSGNQENSQIQCGLGSIFSLHTAYLSRAVISDIGKMMYTEYWLTAMFDCHIKLKLNV